MRTYYDLSAISAIAFSTIVFLAVDKNKVAAIGCDTYYRVTGQIAGCTDVSTEKAQEAWIEKYSVCLERQLTKEIAVYRGKLQTYYAEWQPETKKQNWKFDRLAFTDTNASDLDTSSLSISSTTYRGNADFCDR